MATNEIVSYREWLEDNVKLEDPFSPSSIRILVLHLLMGKNYRQLTEKNTKERLFRTYAWLLKVYDEAIEKYGDDWRSKLLDELLTLKEGGKDEKDLKFWLLGLTKKTSDNLDLSSPSAHIEFLKQTIKYCYELFSKIGNEKYADRAWLLLMAGHATLQIRGSEKSKAGKKLEKIFAKTSLTLLGFELNKNFWMNIGRDVEVGREADAEVESKRGRIRIEVGLISSGNQEVIEDKIGRVGANGVIIFDKLGAKSRVNDTADKHGIKLIQIRHNQPLIELREYLAPRANIQLADVPSTEDGIRAKLDALPDSFFTISALQKETATET